MEFTHPIHEIITRRFSCRKYLRQPLAGDTRQRLETLVSAPAAAPFATPLRFGLMAASAGDPKALRGLGTYGFIKDPTVFIAGAMRPGERNLEDFGYWMERLVLHAADLDVGTCWLGGSFTRSSFEQRLAIRPGEIIPAVVSAGYPGEDEQSGWMRRQVGGAHRLAWEQLFFCQDWHTPLTPEMAGDYVRPLEMVRLAPSASNKQPWRVIRAGAAWHFYLLHTPGYSDSLTFRLLRIPDLQRVDLGIAMCHFELTATEAGLKGAWRLVDPQLSESGGRLYVATWQMQEG